MSSLRLEQVWRTTTFRLTLLYGLVFALGVVGLLGLVYVQSTVYLTRRTDRILKTEANAIAHAAPGQIQASIDEALALNGAQSNIYALFKPDGTWIAGNLRTYPPTLKQNGRSIETGPTPSFPANATLIGRALPSGERLVVGRDADQVAEIRAIILWALIWSGLTIMVAGFGSGLALSIRPLQRLRILQTAGQDIAGGNLKRRMPISQRHDELDMFAATVNLMLEEVERLMSEVKGVTETIAHDLRTPLTRVRAQLHRLQESAQPNPGDLAQITAEIDVVLDRFRALLRISEIEARDRRAGFLPTDLAAIVEQAADLYQPLAEVSGVQFSVSSNGPAIIEADPKLLFEAVSNLVDNAIKFTGEGGAVSVSLRYGGGGPQIVVQDNGPGVPQAERGAVLQQFFRGDRDRSIVGSGLGLSIVTAIVRLHRFQLMLEDAEPGLRAVIECRPAALTY
ncbi:MAG: histidine kinase [Caulobacteraceae bacterium]|nr:histidine kinase [Caulobacteraceae bacterium]